MRPLAAKSGRGINTPRPPGNPLFDIMHSSQSRPGYSIPLFKVHGQWLEWLGLDPFRLLPSGFPIHRMLKLLKPDRSRPAVPFKYRKTQEIIMG